MLRKKTLKNCSKHGDAHIALGCSGEVTVFLLIIVNMEMEQFVSSAVVSNGNIGTQCFIPRDGILLVVTVGKFPIDGSKP